MKTAWFLKVVIVAVGMLASGELAVTHASYSVPRDKARREANQQRATYQERAQLAHPCQPWFSWSLDPPVCVREGRQKNGSDDGGDGE